MTNDSLAKSIQTGTRFPKVTAWEKLEQVMNQCHWIEEGLLHDLPTIESIIEFVELPSKYGVIALQYIDEAITEDGESPKLWNDFVERHGLNWTVYKD